MMWGRGQILAPTMYYFRLQPGVLGSRGHELVICVLDSGLHLVLIFVVKLVTFSVSAPPNSSSTLSRSGGAMIDLLHR